MMTTKPQSGDIPLPEPTPLSRPFWDACKSEDLTFQRCTDCGEITFLPQPACMHCLSPELIWEKGQGKGAIYSWSVVWRPQTPAFEIPYAIAIIDMDEGYRMMSNVVGIDPGKLEVGMRVEVQFHAMNDQITLPYFRPTS